MIAFSLVQCAVAVGHAVVQRSDVRSGAVMWWSGMLESVRQCRVACCSGVKNCNEAVEQ